MCDEVLNRVESYSRRACAEGGGRVSDQCLRRSLGSKAQIFQAHYDHEIIWSIPIGGGRLPDFLVWHFDSKGLYSVRSGYQVEMDRREGASSSTTGIGFSWWRKARVPSKLKIHFWHAFHNAFAQILVGGGIECNFECPRCREEMEDINHSYRPI